MLVMFRHNSGALRELGRGWSSITADLWDSASEYARSHFKETNLAVQGRVHRTAITTKLRSDMRKTAASDLKGECEQADLPYTTKPEAIELLSQLKYDLNHRPM